MKRLVFFFLVVILSISMLGCTEKPANHTEGQIKIFKDQAETISIESSNTWKTYSDLNHEAILQIGNVSKDQYLAVITDDTKVEGALDEYTEEVSTNLAEACDGFASKPVETSINGLPAQTFEVNGVVNHIETVYFVTTIEGKNAYYRIFAWTIKSEYDRNKDILLEAIKTFKEL